MLRRSKGRDANKVICGWFAGGFTWIELLVVVAIISLLVALLLPAVQAARNAAWQVKCQNNLKQIGLAINSYVSQFNVFPGGINGNGYSLHSMILPQLEQTALFNSINYSATSSDTVGSPNMTAARVTVEGFLCPAEAYPTSVLSNNPTARTNYFGNGGFGSQLYGFNGVFFDQYKPPIDFAAITDGSSQTLLASEATFGAFGDGIVDPKLVTFDVRNYGTGQQFEQFTSACQSAGIATNTTTPARSNQWPSSDFGETLFNANLPPGGHCCTNQGAINDGCFSTSSYHADGSNAAFVDGHVRFITNTIAAATWRAASTRASAEIVNW